MVEQKIEEDRLVPPLITVFAAEKLLDKIIVDKNEHHDDNCSCRSSGVYHTLPIASVNTQTAAQMHMQRK